MTKTSSALAALCLLFAFVSEPVLAGEVDVASHSFRLDVTSTTLGSWHRDARDYGDLFERLNVATGTGAWQLGLRLDTATFVSSPSPDVAGRYTLEKASLAWTQRAVEITAGDAYVSVGRGLSLSLRKVDELGIDTTSRGAKLLIHDGDFAGTLAVGIANPQNIDEATGRSIDDPTDLIGAGEASVSFLRGLRVGIHGSIVAFHDGLGLVPARAYRDRYFQLGPTLEAPDWIDHFEFYAEGLLQKRNAADDEGVGVGAYTSASAFFGPLTLQCEGKAYGSLAPVKPNLPGSEFDAVAYNQPPTVERVAQVLEHSQRDIAGGRLRVEWTASPMLSTFVNYGFFRDWLGYDDPESIGRVRVGRIHDPYGGLEIRWDEGRSWFLGSAGWRSVTLDGTGQLVRGEAHAEIDAAQFLDGGWSLTLHAIHLEKKKHESPILDQQYREGTVLLGARLQPWASVSGGYDYTTEPTQPRRDYLSGNVQWDITPSSSLKLFVGASRGGLRCVSGVCRVFPAFEGAKLSVTLRF